MLNFVKNGIFVTTASFHCFIIFLSRTKSFGACLYINSHSQGKHNHTL